MTCLAPKQERKGAAGFKDGENTDQAVLDSIARGQLSRRLVFVDVGCKVSKRPSMFFSHCDGLIVHAFGVLEQERFQIAETHIQAIKKLRHRPAGHNGEVAAKYHAVETRECAINPIFIFADEFLHFSTSSRLGLIDLKMIQQG